MLTPQEKETLELLLNEFSDQDVLKIGYKCEYIPSVDEIKEKVPLNKISPYISFLVWIKKTHQDEVTETEQESLDYIDELLYGYFKKKK